MLLIVTTLLCGATAARADQAPTDEQICLAPVEGVLAPAERARADRMRELACWSSHHPEGVARIHEGQLRDDPQNLALWDNYTAAIHSEVFAVAHSPAASQEARSEAAADAAHAVRFCTAMSDFHPENLDILFRCARLREEAGDDPGAAAFYSLFLAQRPDFAFAYELRGEVYARLGRWKEAEADAARQLRYKPNNASILTTLCVRRARGGDRAGALIAANAALRQADDFDWAYDCRAFVRYREGDYLGALEELKKAIAVRFNNIDPIYLRGIVELKLGRTAEGDADIAAAMRHGGQYEVDLMRDTYGIAPDIAAASQQRWNASSHTVRLKSLEGGADEVCDDTPDDDPRASATYWVMGMMLEDNEHKLACAVHNYTRALALKPDDVLLLVKRGNVYQETWNWDLAMADFQHALALKPDEAGALNGRGNVFLDRRDFKRAIRDYDAALAADPTQTGIYNNLCFARALVGVELDRAAADCAKAPTGLPQAKDSLALVYLRKGDFAKAIALYDEALAGQDWRGMEEARYLRGVARIRSGDVEGGKADIAKAEKTRPGVGAYYAPVGIAP